MLNDPLAATVIFWSGVLSAFIVSRKVILDFMKKLHGILFFLRLIQSKGISQ